MPRPVKGSPEAKALMLKISAYKALYKADPTKRPAKKGKKGRAAKGSEEAKRIGRKAAETRAMKKLLAIYQS